MINKKYELQKLLGKGKFGSVYSGINIKKNEGVAIKFENMSAPIQLLKREATMLNYLYNEKCYDAPIVYWYGVFENYRCIVMSLYECSLHDYSKNKILSPEKIDNIMLQCIAVTENIHKKMIVHRDIKPQNIMISEGYIHFIDFGLATFYVDEKGEHTSQQKHSEIIGTARYVSVNVHNGDDPSRRDDLISIGYLYIYLLYGELAWDKLKSVDSSVYQESSILHERNQERKELKSIENIEITYERLPKLVNYIKYCYSLKYDEAPNYDALKKLFIENNINKS